MEGSRSSDWTKRRGKSVPSGPCHFRVGDRGDTTRSRLSWKGSFHSVLFRPVSDGMMVMLQDQFKGEMIHTSTFKGANENAGKRVLVVGAGTSGHDIAWDHVNCGAGKHSLGRPASNTSSENCSTIAEVVSGLNAAPIRVH